MTFRHNQCQCEFESCCGFHELVSFRAAGRTVHPALEKAVTSPTSSSWNAATRHFACVPIRPWMSTML